MLASISPSCALESERGSSGIEKTLIVLRRMNAAAKNVAIVPFQWITPVEPVIARYLHGLFDCRDGVVGDRKFEQVSFPRAHRLAGISGCNCAVQQRAVGPQQNLDVSERFLKPRQRREWSAQIARDARSCKLNQPVAGGPRDRIVEFGEQHRHPDILVAGLNAGPIGGPAHVDSVIFRNDDVFQNYVMATTSAESQMIPGLHDPDSRNAARNQKKAGARLGFIGAAPDSQPLQNGNACRIDLVARHVPPVGDSPGDGRRQTASCGSSQLRFHTQRVDQSAAVGGIALNQFAERS